VETRLTLRPGQSGTNRLVERFGERLVRARYLYDEKAGRRLKTVELIVESVLASARPQPAQARRPDLRRSHRLSWDRPARTRQAPRRGLVPRAEALWELTWLDAKRLGITGRVVSN
jgi:hypothetical protein